MTKRVPTKPWGTARRTKRRRPHSNSSVAGDVEMYGVALWPDAHLPLDVRLAGRSVWGVRDGVYNSVCSGESIELVLDGTGVLTCNAARHELERGDVFFLHCGSRHTYHALPGMAWHKIFVAMWPDSTQRMMQQLGLHKVVRVRVPRVKFARVKRLFTRILQLAHTKPPFFRDRLSERAYELLIELAQIHHAQAAGAAMPAAVHAAMEHAQQRGCRHVTAHSMAAAAGCSLRHLTRLFCKACHMTVCEWLTRYKMQHACALLQHTNHRVGDIAESVGYLDPQHFTSVFKRVTGRTPRAYRLAAHPGRRARAGQPGGEPA